MKYFSDPNQQRARPHFSRTGARMVRPSIRRICKVASGLGHAHSPRCDWFELWVCGGGEGVQEKRRVVGLGGGWMGVVVVIFCFQMVPDQLCVILNLGILVALNMVIVETLKIIVIT